MEKKNCALSIETLLIEMKIDAVSICNLNPVSSITW